MKIIRIYWFVIEIPPISQLTNFPSSFPVAPRRSFPSSWRNFSLLWHAPLPFPISTSHHVLPPFPNNFPLRSVPYAPSLSIPSPIPLFPSDERRTRPPFLPKTILFPFNIFHEWVMRVRVSTITDWSELWKWVNIRCRLVFDVDAVRIVCFCATCCIQIWRIFYLSLVSCRLDSTN